MSLSYIERKEKIANIVSKKDPIINHEIKNFLFKYKELLEIKIISLRESGKRGNTRNDENWRYLSCKSVKILIKK